MPKPPKMPTYDELVALSNGELVKRMQLALKQLIGYENRSDGYFLARRIYEAYHREREKRMLVGKRIVNPFF